MTKYRVYRYDLVKSAMIVEAPPHMSKDDVRDANWIDPYLPLRILDKHIVWEECERIDVHLYEEEA
jgi:hypothetical protein